VNVRFQHQLIASNRFAAANGWRCGKHFSLDLLIRNKASHGRRELDKYGYHERGRHRHDRFVPIAACIPARLQPPWRPPSPASQELDRYRLLIV
jgi:hypothetical protein